MTSPDRFPLLAAGAPVTPDGTVLDSSDRERLLYVARVLRGLGNQGRHAPLGDAWSEVIVALGTVRKVLGMSTAEFEAEGIVATSPTGRDLADLDGLPSQDPAQE